MHEWKQNPEYIFKQIGLLTTQSTANTTSFYLMH